MGLFNEWWVWMSAALVLAILEVIVPGWIFLGFAIGAFFLGAVMWMGIITSLSTYLLVVVFALLSLVAYLILRQVFGIRRGQVKIWDRDIND